MLGQMTKRDMKTNEMHNQNMFPCSRHFLQATAFDIFYFIILNIQIIKHFMKNNQLEKKREQTSVEENG